MRLRTRFGCLARERCEAAKYPQTAELERRCVAMLARLWGASHEAPAIGCSTTGSSETAMLGGMALKRRWAQRRRAAGLAEDRPNLVMGANVQVCWEKFCRYAHHSALAGMLLGDLRWAVERLQRGTACGRRRSDEASGACAVFGHTWTDKWHYGT